MGMSFFNNFKIGDRFLEVLKRFPIALFFAIATSFALVVFIDDHEHDILRWPIAGYIGFLAVFNWNIYAESYSLSKRAFWIGMVILMLLLVIYGYFIPSELTIKSSCFWYFTIGWSIILHLLCSIIPFFRTYDRGYFVNYNIQIFWAWIRAALYALVVFMAMSLALVALDQLFEINISSINYFRLFILLTGIFQVSFFLSDFPDNFYQNQRDHAPIFKVFIGYVAIPITLVYGLILYAYVIRLLMGYLMVEWVFVLCIWYFVVGYLTWLLSLYFEGFEDSKWMEGFRRYYFIFSVPVIILMLLSLIHNIGNEGIREEFYMASAIGLVAFIILIYQIIKRPSDLRVFPYVLMVVTGFTFWSGRYSVCRYPMIDQQNMLLRDLTEAGLIQNNVLLWDSTKVYNIEGQAFMTRLYYLNDRGGLDFIKAIDKHHLLDHQDIYGSLIKATTISNGSAFQNSFSFTSINTSAIDIQGYQKLLDIKSFKNDASVDYALIQDDFLEVVVDKRLLYKGNLADVLYPLCIKNPKTIAFDLQSEYGELKVIISNVAVNSVEDKNHIIELSGLVLIRDKP